MLRTITNFAFVCKNIYDKTKYTVSPYFLSRYTRTINVSHEKMSISTNTPPGTNQIDMIRKYRYGACTMFLHYLLSLYAIHMYVKY